MPLPGGESDKFGNRYEGRWTVNCMIDILDERAESIRLEPPGKEGEGVEFWLQVGNKREYHQVKRQQSSRGRWTNADLDSRGVLLYFFDKLRNSVDTECVFVSTDNAYQLDEINGRSKRALSLDEFQQEYLNTDDYRKLFSELLHYWHNCTPNVAFDVLRRIRVETISERQLKTNVESRLASLVEGDVATVSEILAQLALDSVGLVRTALDLWRLLDKRGHKRRRWGNDPHVLDRINTCNQAYLNPLRQETIAGKPILRKETHKVLEILEATNTKRVVMITGDAGVGKSGVMNLLATSMENQDWPYLAFRVDRLEPTLLPKKVGQDQLDLPGSPANVLAAVAQGKRCVLFIDQLDAVSLVSGRHPDFFDCINEIIQEALSHVNMRVLLACRKFDLQNDPRFRHLTAENGIAQIVEVEPLDRQTVLDTLHQLAIDVGRLNEEQLRLLSVPLHMSLLASVLEQGKHEGISFDTIRDLFDMYWDYKRRKIAKRWNHPIQWETVIDSLCDFMSEKQMLSAPRQILEDAHFLTDAEHMTSEHVLIDEHKRYLFFHESFFDYAFARRFGNRGNQLSSLLLESEQHLFRRAQVRQILGYEREGDPENNYRYLENVRELLVEPSIRFHIKSVVFAILAQHQNPWKQEWEILRQILDSGDYLLIEEVWRTMFGSAAWVQLLYDLGTIQDWLASNDEELVNRSVTLLQTVQKDEPDLVAELVEPFVNMSDEWNNRLIYLMRYPKLSKGRRFLDLYLHLVDIGLLDDIKGPAANSDYWSSIYLLPSENPVWACEVIRHRLDRLLELSLAHGETNPFNRNSYDEEFIQSDDNVFATTANGAPLVFIEQLLPFMLRVIQLNLRNGEKSPTTDNVWGYRIYGKAFDIGTALLSAMEKAFCLVAVEQPKRFADICGELVQLDFETIQFLLIRGFSANGSEFSDIAITYVLENPLRLNTGYSSHDYWVTRELIEKVTPSCTQSNLSKLEDLLLSYYPDTERDRWGYEYKRFGYAQFVLLEAIESNRRSDKVIARLREHRRSGKFKNESITKAPTELEFQTARLPIPEIGISKMTDKQWIKAVTKYDTEGLLYLTNGEMIRGIEGLASCLSDQTQKDPSRFINLLRYFPAGTDWRYFNAVLTGVLNVKIDHQLLSELCKRCHALPGRPCGRSIADLIANNASLPELSDDMIGILVWYVTKDPDPQPGFQHVTIEGKSADEPESIFLNGFNSVRGRASLAIAALIFADPQRGMYLVRVLEVLVNDPSAAVKSCVAEALVAVLNFDRELAVDMFITLCENEQGLLGTRYVERFINYAITTHFDKLEPVLKRMLQSQIADVATVGSRQLCVASLSLTVAIPSAMKILVGSESQQLGAAKVFATNIRNAQLREYCEESLSELFDSRYEAVQLEASRCFDRFQNDELGEFTELIETFVDSKAFENNHRGLLRALENTTAQLPEITILVCERFLEQVGDSAGDIRTRAALNSDAISRLIIRVYSQNVDNEELQSRSLDVIDRMVQIRAYGLSNALALFER